ncbi:MAG: TROVE domain-containing protein [Planctomycetes bacterium]|nr:TROVE domain-containing protein [Planctomycetota bacterium]
MICGEAQYYRRDKDKKVAEIKKFLEHLLFPEFYQESAADYFDKIVADALDHDFEGALKFVDKLRNEYLMRLNSNALLVKAVHHPKRAEFNKANPLVFKRAIESVGCLPTDWTTQFKLLKESGKPIPTIWKRAIASKLQSMSNYHAAKYLHGSKTQGKVKKAKTSVPEKSNDSVEDAEQPEQQPEPQPDQEEQQRLQKKALANLTDLIRVTHPTPTGTITELVKTGKVAVADDEQTWEKLRSAGKTWKEINAQIRLPHMALLRNLRNIVEEYARREDAMDEMRELVERLVNGVKGGKQFPFRYFSAYKMLKDTADLGRRSQKKPTSTEKEQDDVMTPAQQKTLESLREMVLEGLNRCVLESVECIPAMKGRVDCLSDNSGSSRQGMVSEYGTVKIFEIANLSDLLGADVDCVTYRAHAPA